MSKKYFLSSFIMVFLLGFVSYKTTYSLFSDTAQSTGNVFSASTEFPTSTPTPTPPTANHLVINEVMFNPDNPTCSQGEPNSEWIEIYNPTVSDVSLSGWSIHDNTASDALPAVILPAGFFAIVTNCDQSEFQTNWPFPAGTVYIDIGSSIGSGLANGGDEVRLVDNSLQTVDHMSYGTNTDAFNPSVLIPVANHSLERDPDGVDTDTAADFVDRTTPQPGL